MLGKWLGTLILGYKIDYGAYGDQPLDRPYVRKRGMASTTTDLTPGSSQNTNQIPGYAGFLPRTTHNPHALAQADGELLRSPRATCGSSTATIYPGTRTQARGLRELSRRVPRGLRSEHDDRRRVPSALLGVLAAPGLIDLYSPVCFSIAIPYRLYHR